MKKDAFGLELDAFADVLLSRRRSKYDNDGGSPKKEWPITAQQCINVQKVIDAARESCESGQVVDVVY